jgi:hypothetical protein
VDSLRDPNLGPRDPSVYGPCGLCGRMWDAEEEPEPLDLGNLVKGRLCPGCYRVHYGWSDHEGAS